ncbi:MAG: rhamnogalacturonan acetylesterase, partial [Planctomycetales bacterium]|nr:rhamnogalacturonan acetylesterase [Planctomycetales bacterium]
MNRQSKRHSLQHALFLVTLSVFLSELQAQTTHERENGIWTSTTFEDAKPDLPTLFVASDSTAATGGRTTRGWGAVLIDYFDVSKLNIINRAVGGRSFRSFTREGHWDQIVEHLKEGDFVIIEFGHNDGGGAHNSRGRGDVPGISDETETVIGRDGKEEIVHTFGWYLRKYIRDARSKGATPIVSTTTVRNLWGDGRVERGMGNMRDWAEEVAKQENAIFIDHSNLGADHYEKVGREAATTYHPQDHTHTNVAGAIANAETFLAGLRANSDAGLNQYLNDKGRSIEPVAKQPHWGTFRPNRDRASSGNKAPPNQNDVRPDYGVDRRGRKLRWPPGVEPGMPHPEHNPALPTLWMIGDSTVKEGRDNGLNGGRWGWGHELGRYFDLSRINIENQALGGTSSRSFITEGWWKSVLEMIRPGDFVVIQFGHNDGSINSRVPRIRARASLRGIGDETEETELADGKTETAHTYGWYLKQYIADIRKAKATPIVCSPIPRNTWQDGQVVKGEDDSYTGWAKQVAELEKVPFINLN